MMDKEKKSELLDSKLEFYVTKIHTIRYKILMGTNAYQKLNQPRLELYEENLRKLKKEIEVLENSQSYETI